MIGKLAITLFGAAMLSGCVVQAAYDVGTAPIRATSKVVDWTTTSRSEADRNRGRRMRKECKKDARDAKRRARQDATPVAPLPAYCR